MNARARIATLSCGFAAGALLLAAPPAQARVLDTETARCGSALVTAKLEADGRDVEADVEVYSGPRERWTVTLRSNSGAVLGRIARTTNREGEFDAWRYLPSRPKVVEVTAKGPSGTCTVRLQA